MAIVADNDFAIFGGTAAAINNLLYQNSEAWPDQISNLSTLAFLLPAGDTTFYVLGMGGGGEENISGTVNGVDMTNVNVFMSSAIQSYLTGYNNGNAVAEATFVANLADVQTALSNLSWSSPDVNSSDTVIGLAAPNGVGFHFDDGTAHLFRFNASEVGVETVPEPSSIGLVLISFANLMLFRRRARGALRVKGSVAA